MMINFMTGDIIISNYIFFSENQIKSVDFVRIFFVILANFILLHVTQAFYILGMVVHKPFVPVVHELS